MDALVPTASFTFMFHSVKTTNASAVRSEKLTQVDLNPLFPGARSPRKVSIRFTGFGHDYFFLLIRTM